MPTPECVSSSEQRITFTRNRVKRQRRILAEAEGRPESYAFAHRYLRLLEDSLVALEASHSTLVALARKAKEVSGAYRG